LNYYQFHIGDWALHTSHLTLEEDAVYRRLIDFYYDSESPIPTETQPVIRRLRLGLYSETVALILVEFFTLEADGWHNYRADKEIAAYKAKATQAQENGKRGGRPPRNRAVETQPVILANPEITGSKANQEPLTINQELLESTASGDESPETKPKRKVKVDPVPYAEILAAYCEALPTLPQPQGMTPKRKSMARAIWNDLPKSHEPDFWRRYFKYIAGTPFLCEMNCASLNWFLNLENLYKVIEGNYRNA
jgi:uncharacterized protein YdaU (DUF1376 family)